MADLIGEVATHRHSARRAASFSRVTLDMADASNWAEGMVVLHSHAGEKTRMACSTFSALSAGGALFPVSIVAPDGFTSGPFMAEAIVTGIPVAADCFVFSRRRDGFWEGVTMTTRHGKTSINPYACDPA